MRGMAREHPEKAPEGGRLLQLYEEKLGKWIGVLSKFIIKKQYDTVTEKGSRPLDENRARTMAELIISEASPLIGPSICSELRRDLFRVTEDYFKEAG